MQVPVKVDLFEPLIPYIQEWHSAAKEPSTLMYAQMDIHPGMEYYIRILLPENLKFSREEAAKYMTVTNHEITAQGHCFITGLICDEQLAWYIERQMRTRSSFTTVFQWEGQGEALVGMDFAKHGLPFKPDGWLE